MYTLNARRARDIHTKGVLDTLHAHTEGVSDTVPIHAGRVGRGRDLSATLHVHTQRVSNTLKECAGHSVPRWLVNFRRGTPAG